MGGADNLCAPLAATVRDGVTAERPCPLVTLPAKREKEDVITTTDERTYLCLQIREGVFGRECADEDRLIDAQSVIFETVSDLEPSFVGDDVVGDEDFLLFRRHGDLPFRSIKLDLARLPHTVVSHLPGLQLHDVGKDLLSGAVVLDSRVSLVELGDEACAGGHIEEPGMVLSAYFAFGQQGEDATVHDKGSILLHEVKAEGGASVLGAVEDTDLRIELPEIDAPGDMAQEDGIAVVEHLIDDIGGSSLFPALEGVSGICDKGGIGLPVNPGGAGLEEHGTPAEVIERLPIYRQGGASPESIDGFGKCSPESL